MSVLSPALCLELQTECSITLAVVLWHDYYALYLLFISTNVSNICILAGTSPCYLELCLQLDYVYLILSTLKHVQNIWSNLLSPLRNLFSSLIPAYSTASPSSPLPSLSPTLSSFHDFPSPFFLKSRCIFPLSQPFLSRFFSLPPWIPIVSWIDCLIFICIISFCCFHSFSLSDFLWSFYWNIHF